jgi:23S rRNA pseudouridine1911/1915/1917 synthase
MQILHSDRDITVIIKPVGMDSEHDVPAALGGEVYPVHRLDKNVGGVMVYARTKSAAAALSKAIQDGNMIKEYVARVHGTPPQQGDWEDLLFKDSAKNKVFVVKKERRGVKKARLEFVRLTDEENALVRIRLHTGRSHQIRVQFASRGFPLLGDSKYGARDDVPTPMLFSCRLTFPLKEKIHTYAANPDWAPNCL